MRDRSRRWIRLVSFVMLTLSLLACELSVPDLFPQEETPPPTEETTEPTEPPATEEPSETSTPEVEIPKDIRKGGFAHLYKTIPVQLPGSFYLTDYTLPVNLDAVANRDRFALSPDQTLLLRENGFVAKPADWLEYFQLYENVRYQDLPVFVTTDSVYHVYHLLFDKLLRDLERDALAPNLVTLTNALAEAARVQYEQAQGTPLEDSALRVWGYFVVPQQLLLESPPPIPGPLAQMVNDELALITAHSGIDMSPLLTLPEAFEEGLFCDPNATPEEAEKFYCEDYSQYVPRGHYTRDEQLMRYFRAMMWYGRINLRLKHARETRMALLVTKLIRETSVNGQPAAEIWASIYDPTVFLVGKSDDLSFHEYGPLMDVVYGPNPTLNDLADDAKLTTFRDAARQLPPPQINSMWVYIWEDEEEATQGFRFMGQRFVLDAYIFEQMIWREVGT
ncbi:MAG: DUF3160 domain-containing protein, partial [Anaerolineae bacterium]